MMFNEKSRNFLLGLIIPILVLIFWKTATYFAMAPRQLLVPPEEVFQSLLDLGKDGSLAENLQISLIRVLLGFSWGTAAGLFFGTAMGSSRIIDRIVGPLFHGFRQVPMFGWMPLLILLFGIDEKFKIIFIGLSAFYPMVLNTYEGIKNVSKEFVEVATVFEYSRARLFGRVIIPAAMPSIFIGLRTSVSMSWMSVVGAELVASSSGIGFLMSNSRSMFKYEIVFAGVIVIGIIGFLMNIFIGRLERYILRWRKTFITG
jgi:ABC-type nitrate/sulfonate/bicarbonate transport system, permease component